MPEKEFTKAYDANMSSLKALETTCESDEANLTAKLTSLQLATNAVGTKKDKVTAGKYERARRVKLGELVFVEYKTDDDIAGLKDTQGKKNDFLFKGQVYVKNEPIKVLVFREKAT